MADVLADEVVARDGDEMAFAHVAEAMKDARHAHRHRRLAGAWIAGEAMCSVGGPAASPTCSRARVDQQQSRDLANALLDRREPDEIAVELGDGRADIGVRLQRSEVNDLGRRPPRSWPQAGNAHRPSPCAAFSWSGL